MKKYPGLVNGYNMGYQKPSDVIFNQADLAMQERERGEEKQEFRGCIHKEKTSQKGTHSAERG